MIDNFLSLISGAYMTDTVSKMLTQIDCYCKPSLRVLQRNCVTTCI